MEKQKPIQALPQSICVEEFPRGNEMTLPTFMLQGARAGRGSITRIQSAANPFHCDA
ncbi:hypothetical protein [Magnetofaba australis]|uniref:hypothetical protein n=1 Tax=Magnetofaba australis TaxID=1472297 RepID=UPI001301F2D3|nr:hypothetical protein [Magnetofaba australis]